MTGDYELGVAGILLRVLQDGVLGRHPVRLLQQRVAVVKGCPSRPKCVLGVLSTHAQAVLEPLQGHLVARLRRTRGNTRGQLVICVPEKVQNDLGVYCMDPRSGDGIMQGEGGGPPDLISCPRWPLPTCG